MHRTEAPNNRYKPAILRETVRKNTGNSMYLLIGVAYSPVRMLSWLKWHRILGAGRAAEFFRSTSLNFYLSTVERAHSQ